MSKTYTAPEDMEKINVKVITTSLENPDEKPQVMIIDYSNYGHRRWLAKHSWWAFKTNHMISTTKTDEAVTFVERPREVTNERA